jgi:hypothetical protein
MPAIDVKSLHAKIGELTLENDSQSSCARDVGDDVVELEIHLGERFLHVLNVRGRILEQTLALAYVGTQCRDQILLVRRLICISLVNASA